MTEQDVQWGNLFASQMFIDELEELKSKVISSESGVNGFRYYNNKLQVKRNDTWVDIPLDEFHMSN